MLRICPYLAEKSLLDFRCGEHTHLLPAEPAIAVARNKRINRISYPSRHEPEQTQAAPPAGETRDDFDCRITAQENPPIRDKHKSLKFRRIQTMALKNFSADFRLDGGESESCRRIMPNNKMDQAAAEIAQSIE